MGGLDKGWISRQSSSHKGWLCGFSQFITWHDLHVRYLLQLHHCVQPSVLQLQWTIYRRLSGAAALFVMAGTNRLSSNFHPQSMGFMSPFISAHSMIYLVINALAMIFSWGLCWREFAGVRNSFWEDVCSGGVMKSPWCGEPAKI